MPGINVSIPQISTPLQDEQGLTQQQWYQFFDTLFKRTGGVTGDNHASLSVQVLQLTTVVNGNTTAITGLTASKADKTITISAGNGLTGGGDLSAARTLAAKQDTGWTAATGTGNKGAYAAYAGHTASASYVQAEAQATDDAVKAVSARLVAIETALRNNGAIN